MATDRNKRIQDRAYHLWEAAGRPHGRDEEFWHLANEAEHAGGEEAAPATPAKSASPRPAKANEEVALPTLGKTKPKKAGKSEKSAKAAEPAKPVAPAKPAKMSKGRVQQA